MGQQLNGQMIVEYLRKTETKRSALAAQVGVCRSILDAMIEGYLPKRNREAILSRLAHVLGVSVAALIIQVPDGQRTA